MKRFVNIILNRNDSTKDDQLDESTFDLWKSELEKELFSFWSEIEK